MNLRVRKLIGMLALVAFVLFYAGFAVWIAGNWINHLNAGVQIFFYLVAGFVWIFPAFVIIRWSSGPASTD
ncbi:MAG: DUF2842 domain-containing protein [Hyphomicrobiales bacterium]